MVKIREIQQPKATLYMTDGTNEVCVGEVTNYAQWLDVRVQIHEEQPRDVRYYAMFGEDKILLDRNGTEDHFPEGWFGDFEVHALLKLC